MISMPTRRCPDGSVFWIRPAPSKNVMRSSNGRDSFSSDFTCRNVCTTFAVTPSCSDFSHTDIGSNGSQ